MYRLWVRWAILAIRGSPEHSDLQIPIPLPDYPHNTQTYLPLGPMRFSRWPSASGTSSRRH
eukprot:9170659-Pyramimonas_sp.AAC.1